MDERARQEAIKDWIDTILSGVCFIIVATGLVLLPMFL